MSVNFDTQQFALAYKGVPLREGHIVLEIHTMANVSTRRT